MSSESDDHPVPRPVAPPGYTPVWGDTADMTRGEDSEVGRETAVLEPGALDGFNPEHTLETSCGLPEGVLQATDPQAPRFRPAPQAKILDLRAGTTFARYEVIREIDRGGMSVVFLARDVRLGRRVAIKFLAHRDASWSARFQAEARATARCEHENIVIIYDVGEAFEHSYMALEYLEGITLREWLIRHWRPDELATTADPNETLAQVSPVRAAELMIPVVRALAHAHSQGLVHRDLKPSNIMLVDNGTIKVLDFGVAKAIGRAATPLPFAPEMEMETETEAEMEVEVDAAELRLGQSIEPDSSPDAHSLTRADVLIGTLPYMSPEQWGADRVDQRSDLFAVGIMLWEMVTGKHPLAPLSIARLRTVEKLDTPMPLLREQRPELGAFADIVDRCLAKHKDQRIPSAAALLAELEALVASHARPAPSAPSGEPPSPFAGMAAFQEADASRFFGRDRDIASIVVQLRNQQLVTVVAPAGAGKSSLIRAGVIPALRRSGQEWQIFIVRPGREPLASLAAVLAQMARGEASDADESEAVDERERLAATLRAQPGYLGAALRSRARRRRGRALLFVDQFEQLYALDVAEDERRLFCECLDGVADDASSPLRVIVALRSDVLDRVAEDRSFTHEITRGLTLLPPMGRAELREVLYQPLASLDVRFESDDMVEHMLDSLQSTRSPLPLLQFTVARLWDLRDRERGLLTRASYDQLGGVAGALATHADAVLAAMSTREQALARAALTSLVTDERKRARVGLAALRALAVDGDALEHVVHKLADARLLLLETDLEHGATVELSHESLIQRWSILGQWLDEDHEDAQFRARLHAAAREWSKQGKTPDLLWRGRAAEDCKRWLERRSEQTREQPDDAQAELFARDREYLEAVIDLAERTHRRQRRTLIGAFAFLGAVAFVVSLLAVRAGHEARRAEAQAARAEAQAQETAEQAARADQAAAKAHAEARAARNATRMAAARTLISDPTAVLALTREIEGQKTPPGWYELARYALQSGVARAVLSHPDSVGNAVFSPDGARVATASDDKLARLWPADGVGPPIELGGHTGVVESARFSPDGTRVVTASQDTTARVFRIDDRGQVGPPVVLAGHQQEVYHAEFSPDGSRVVTASGDRTARIFHADGSGRAIVLRGHGDRVYAATFSPDGERIATASGDGQVRMFRADGRGPPLVLTGHQGRVYAVAFSPDGSRVVSASEDKSARVWQSDGSGAVTVLAGHDDRVYWAVFSPDGERVATASMDKTVRLFHADGSGSPVVFRGHQDKVYSVGFSPDGEYLVSASGDRSARIWQVRDAYRPLVFRGHDARVYSASFSPDGRRVVSASGDKSARVWQSDGSGAVTVLAGHEDVVYAASFSPDSTRVVTASADRTARVWSADGSGRPVLLSGHRDRVYAASFSPDGTRVVTASGDHMARIFHADGRGPPVVLAGHRGRVYSAAFSPDGTRVVTASADQTARVFRADGSGQAIVLGGHEDRLTWAEFSPDGRHVITASYDHTARIFHADGSGRPVVLSGHEAVVAVRGGRPFSPDGTRVLTHSEDATIRLWDTAGGAQLLSLRASDAVNSAAFSPDGTCMVSAHADNTVWLWRDLAALTGADDPRLWRASSYCMPPAMRVKHLGTDPATAEADHARCLERVAHARTGSNGNRP